MRNLKKILCLVLVFAMVCSMFVTANAQFKDDAEIDNLVAAEFLNGIGVLKGRENGNFDPKGTLTRAEGATIIARLILGAEAEKLSAVGTIFDDVKANDWFAGYVEYCVAEGIVAGYDKNTFGPSDKLTVAQFAKMLLTALGYESAREGFTGADWATPVVRLVNSLGLLDEAVTSLNAACSRQVAAQMALNTLKTTMVTYGSQGTSVKGEGFEVVIGGSKAYPATAQDYPVAAANIGNITTAADANDETFQFAERYWKDIKLDNQLSSDSVFGRPVGQTWKYKDVEVDTKPEAELLKTYTGTVYASTLAALVGDKTVDSIESNDAGTMGLKVFVDGVAATISNTRDFISNKADDAEKTLPGTGAGVLTEVYADDNFVYVVSIKTYVAVAADDYNEKNEELTVTIYDGNEASNGEMFTNDQALSVKDFDVEGYVEDDFLLVTVDKKDSANEADWKVVTVEAAKTVSGEIETFATSNVNYLRSITVGGKKYGYAATCQPTVSGNTIALNAAQQGTQITLVLDAYGNVITYADAVEANNYVYVAGIYSPNSNITVTGKGTYTAALYFADGTYEEVEVGAYYLNNVKQATIPTGMNMGWCTYTVNADGKYVFNTTSRATGDLQLASFTGNATTIASGVYASNTTTYIVVDETGDANVYTGFKNVPNVYAALKLGGDAQVGYGIVVDAVKNANNNYAKVVFVGPATSETDITARGAKSDRSTLLYVYREAYAASVDANGVTFNTQNYVLNNGKQEAITVDTGYLTKGLYTDVKYDMTTGYITAATPVSADATIAADGSDEFVVVTMTTAAPDAEFVDGILNVNGTNYPFAEDYDVIMIKAASGNYATYSTASMNRVVKEANAATGTVTFTGVLDAEGEVIETLYVAIP